MVQPLPVVVIGSGPAGLMAAETLAAAGLTVTVYERMPEAGRRLLRAGVGGLNLTHSEPLEDFLNRYDRHRSRVEPWLMAFGPAELRAWAAALGVPTFVGSSGRVFPEGLKAAPLLTAWLERLKDSGVEFAFGRDWLGWTQDGRLRFGTATGQETVAAAGVVLALGGASWPQLGSTGHWTELLADLGIASRPWEPANCGFEVVWSPEFQARAAGQPIKAVRVTLQAADGRQHERLSELMLTSWGMEGSPIYALAAPLRETIKALGSAALTLDLFPDRSRDSLVQALLRPRGSRSWSNHLQHSLGLTGARLALVKELTSREVYQDPVQLTAALKQLSVRLVRPRPLAEAISSAGGLDWSELNGGLGLVQRPGVYCAGEMLDWEAPTGGYLLTACWSSGRWAGQHLADWLIHTASQTK